MRFCAVCLSLALLCACSSSPQPTPQEQLRAADAAFRQGDYARAAATYYALRERFPENVALRLSLGAAYQQLGWHRYAGGEFSRAVELSNRTNALAWLALGAYYAHTNEWRNARLCFEHARTLAPENPMVYRKLGDAFFQEGEYTHAAYHFQHAARMSDPNDDLYALIGASRERAAQWRAAVDAYTRAHEINPHNARVVHRLALLYRDRFNNIPKARTYFQLLEKLDSDIARAESAAFHRAFAESVVPAPHTTSTPTSPVPQDVELAETHEEDTTTTVVAVSPSTPTLEDRRQEVRERQQHSRADFYQALAEKSLANNLYKEAVRYYSDALKEAPSRGHYNREIARIYETHLDDLLRALEYYDAYLAYAQNHDITAFEQTVAHVASVRESYNRIEADRRRAQREQEEQRMREEEERRQRAEEERRAAFAAAQEQPQSYSDVIAEGARYMRDGNIEEARRFFQKAITINDAYPNAYYNLGLVYLVKTNYTTGIEYFTMALEKNPQYAESHLALGTVYERMQRLPEAIEHFTLYLELAPNTSFADSVREWLTRHAGAR